MVVEGGNIIGRGHERKSALKRGSRVCEIIIEHEDSPKSTISCAHGGSYCDRFLGVAHRFIDVVARAEQIGELEKAERIAIGCELCFFSFVLQDRAILRCRERACFHLVIDESRSVRIEHTINGRFVVCKMPRFFEFCNGVGQNLECLFRLVS